MQPDLSDLLKYDVCMIVCLKWPVACHWTNRPTVLPWFACGRRVIAVGPLDWRRAAKTAD